MTYAGAVCLLQAEAVIHKVATTHVGLEMEATQPMVALKATIMPFASIRAIAARHLEQYTNATMALGKM